MVARSRWRKAALLAAGGVVALFILAVGVPRLRYLLWVSAMTEKSATAMVLKGSGGFVYAAVDPAYAARVLDASLCRPATGPGPEEPSTGFSLCEPPMIESAVRRGAVLKLPNGTPARLDAIECVAHGKLRECEGHTGYAMQILGEEEICKLRVAKGAGRAVTVWAPRASVRGTVAPL